MNPSLSDVARVRAEAIAKSLARHRLVFVQAGFAFEPLREEMLSQLGHVTSVSERDMWSSVDDHMPLVVTDLEVCAGPSHDVLGEVRELVFSVLDAGRQVCLVSRAPRIAFQSVAGSSVLEDSALLSLPLLEVEELCLEAGEYAPPGWRLPCVTFGHPVEVETFRAILRELGQGLVAALDHALFEVNPKGVEGLDFLSHRELEGLRGSGLVEVTDGAKTNLVEPSSVKTLREAISAHISETVLPAATLSTVSTGLWFVERKIRSEARAAAIAKFGTGWRGSCLGGLTAEVLRRAQLDTNVAAKSISDIRDPLEWLTLGELMDLVRSETFDHLGVEPAIWRKLQEQLVPVRNRLAHVRMLKAGDDEVVTMWASLIKSRFGQ